MFEYSLIVVNSDCLAQSTDIVLMLIKKGFFIQTRRILQFSAEHAAEFYKNEEESTFMRKVILLSKGRCEAILVTKENAIEHLLNTMICYFCSSRVMSEFVHVSKSKADALHEISFVFPNHILEPSLVVDKKSFCKSKVTSTVVEKAYDIQSQGLLENWCGVMSEWLMMSNSNVPIMTNMCSDTVSPLKREKAQQTALEHPARQVEPKTSTDSCRKSTTIISSFMSVGSSMKLSSSSCITCSDFDGDDYHAKEPDPCLEYVKAKMTRPKVCKSEERVKTPEWDESSISTSTEIPENPLMTCLLKEPSIASKTSAGSKTSACSKKSVIPKEDECQDDLISRAAEMLISENMQESELPDQLSVEGEELMDQDEVIRAEILDDGYGEALEPAEDERGDETEPPIEQPEEANIPGDEAEAAEGDQAEAPPAE
ncbi:uncharacterized protein LOC119684932 [Teleopsis dalmanni]|uniref:uncharacterized protein LOC119684932 n=1 Tax=Teleopsis dalmanni TaxID=139649 RepID=UPI0018CFDC86|nr:uncharacterized protein LOC119684932 [Teleopsis dalmanni]